MPTQVLQDKTIRHSYKDRFELTATLKNYQLVEGDAFYLSIEQGNRQKLQLLATYLVDGQDVRLQFVADTQVMSQLSPGNYIYDVHIDNNGQLKTTMFVAKFRVEEVAHDGRDST